MPATACCSFSRSLPGPWPGHYNCVQFIYLLFLLICYMTTLHCIFYVKPAFHGACFGAVSAPTLSARVPRRARAAFEKERFHYEHSSCFHGADKICYPTR